MKGTPVYIHTRSRLNFIDRILPVWLSDQKEIGRITLVVEPTEKWATVRHMKEACGRAFESGKVRVMELPRADRGMGAARAHVVKHAHSLGEEVILMSDDDLYPMRGRSDVRLLVNHIKETDSIGIGVCVSFYGLTLGNDFIKNSSEVVPVPGSWGYRLFALNIPMAVKAGLDWGVANGFDPALDVGWEDHEVARMALVQFGEQWAIHTGVMATSIGARYSPGGIAALLPDLADRKRREAICHQRIFDRWGNRYISDPSQGKAYRCNWTRLLADFGPSSR